MVNPETRFGFQIIAMVNRFGVVHQRHGRRQIM
jgi:hypothetical protein